MLPAIVVLRPARVVTLLTLATLAPVTGCRRSVEVPRQPPLEELEGGLSPAGVARALRRAGGGHYHAVTTMEFDSPGPPGQAALKDGVTTTTDAWVDKAGQYRLVETNDRDGGREVILHGKDLAVALRYGRLIRRPMQEPETTRFLEEALGGLNAAWEIAGRFAEVTRRDEATASGNATIYEIKKAAEARAVKADFENGPPLQKWRETVNVDALDGLVRLDAASMAPLQAKLEARFSLNRDGVPMTGLVRVDAEALELGQVKPIEAPQAEELQVRQRTILEERALLGRAGGTEGAHR